jgi:hypothetical protein
MATSTDTGTDGHRASRITGAITSRNCDRTTFHVFARRMPSHYSDIAASTNRRYTDLGATDNIY